MLGAGHYGLRVGRKITRGSYTGKYICTHKNLCNWHTYPLPKPGHITSSAKEAGHKTWLICLIQFVIAPELRRIVALNQGGKAWGHTNGGASALYITFLPNSGQAGLLLHISSPQELQRDLRGDFITQQARQGVRVVFADEDTVFLIPGRWDDSRYRRESDEEDENDMDRSLVPNADW